MRARILCLLLLGTPGAVWGQTDSTAAAGDVRVSVVLNADGSRTNYETDTASHSSTATTTDKDGKLREKIRYTLDESGRYSRGDVFGSKDQFRFRARYQYDGSGHVLEEQRETKDGTSLGKIVFQYDASGHQSGYAVYDAAGKVMGRTSAVATPAKRPSSR